MLLGGGTVDVVDGDSDGWLEMGGSFGVGSGGETIGSGDGGATGDVVDDTDTVGVVEEDVDGGGTTSLGRNRPSNWNSHLRKRNIAGLLILEMMGLGSSATEHHQSVGRFDSLSSG